MSADDQRNDDASRSLVTPSLANGVPRRSFLQYVAAMFGAAMLPEMSGCGSEPAGVGSSAAAFDFGSLKAPLWVTRKEDGLSLGLQFANLAVDANHRLALAPGATAGDAYVVMTFPPQHVIEDAVSPPSGSAPFAPSLTHAYASGASRVIFKVPASYGAAGGVPLVNYDLAGVLSLCAQSSTNVAANAASNAGTTTYAPLPIPLPAPTPAPGTQLESQPRRLGFNAAKIDRAIARHHAAAASRLEERAVRLAAPMTIEATIVRTHHGTTPAPPAAGETSLEVPFRLLVSPNEKVGWSHASTPVTSSSNRSELWHTRMAMRNPATGRPDPSLGGLTVRALWTRDWDLYNAVKGTTGCPASIGTGSDIVVPTIADMVPNVVHRDRFARDTGDLSANATPPLDVDRLILSPLGATLDLRARFTDGIVSAWLQQTTLGRDERVEVVELGSVLPFGHAAARVRVHRRNTDPSKGAVGSLYATDTLILGQPVVSYGDRPNASDYRLFPFTAVELPQTSIPMSLGLIDPSGMPYGPGWVNDPSGGALSFVAIGTDHRGRAIKTKTPLLYVPNADASTVATYLASARDAWNKSSPSFALDGQRVAYAESDKDDTTYETQTFAVVLATTGGGGTPVSLVPQAKQIAVAVEAIRHLATRANGQPAPSANAVFEYDTNVFASSGFGAANPNEVFFVLNTALTPVTPTLRFTQDAAKTGGLVAPDMAILALSRAAGPVSGDPANLGAGSSIYSGFNPSDFFKQFSPTLLGFISLKDIVGAATSEFMPKMVVQELAKAEHFVEEILGLASTLATALRTAQALAQQALADAKAAGDRIAAGVSAAGAPLTNAEKAALSAAQALATKANGELAAYAGTLQTLASNAQAVYTDCTSLAFDKLVTDDGSGGDLPQLLTSIDALLAQLTASVESAPYAGGLTHRIQSALDAVRSYLKPVQGATHTVAEIIKALKGDLRSLSQGLDLAKSLTLKLTWRPQIQGLNAGSTLGFRPASADGLALDVTVRAKPIDGKPAGTDVRCRLDQFAIGFAQVPALDPAVPAGAAMAAMIEKADVALIFDHIQVQMLAGHKPDIDIVFKDIHFGGDLAFVETIKSILPADGFSDPPYVHVDLAGLTAGFTLGVPNVAIGIFSLENIAIAAKLTLPFIAPPGDPGLTFSFDFCTPDHPFLVTVAMLGGGGYFGLTMNMKGLASVSAAIEVCAQLAFDFVVASGCLSIEVGIYFKYDATANRTRISGYLRLRGELDVAGIITISIELYLEISYTVEDGKVTAKGHIKIDVHLLFFSLSVEVPFERSFAGSNGDPTFADLMRPQDPVKELPDPLTGAVWDPLADYCLAYA